MATERDKTPQAEQPDRLASSARSEARQELENEGNPQGAAVFTKGDNAPTFNQTGLPYDTTEMNRQAHEPDGGADKPGGDGATPLSAERMPFLDDLVKSGHFGDRVTAAHWAKAVFNVLRARALDADPDTFSNELAQVVRVGEAPAVQVEEMMWGGDFIKRWSRMLNALQQPTKQQFLRDVAQAASSDAADPWVEDAVYNVLGAIKSRSDSVDPSNLGELQSIWQQA